MNQLLLKWDVLIETKMIFFSASIQYIRSNFHVEAKVGNEVN